MTLSTRVSAFLLAALAIVMGIVVVAACVSARFVLHHQLEQRLKDGVNALVASAEIEPHELEWDREERQIELGRGTADDEVQWMIRRETGQVIDRSPNLSPEGETVLNEGCPQNGEEPTDIQFTEDWMTLHQRVRAAEPWNVPEDDPPDDQGYPELMFSTAVTTRPVEAALSSLYRWAGGLALAVWIVAAILGRWYCQRALAPLSRMTEDLRRLTATPHGEPLHAPETRDELQDLGEAFNTLRNRWLEMFERQASFSSAVAHQLRSPLTVMLGELELARRRTRSPEENLRTIGRVHDAAADLRKTIEGLLFLTRLESAADLPDAIAIDLGSWLHEYAGRWDRHPRRDDIRFHTPLGEPIIVSANTTLLAQLLDNLIENAAKYSEPGSRIDIELTAERHDAVISVTDSGIGITAEDLPNVFKPFYRSKAVRGTVASGVGLGLPIAKRLTEAHGGTLDVRSRPEGGCQFDLKLPRRNAAASRSEDAIKRDTSAAGV